VAGLAVLLVAVGVAVAFAFAGGSPSPAANGSADNVAAVSLTTVKRQDLSQQTQVSATLGYADPSVISVPAGTAPANVQQAQQQATSAQAAVQSAAATLATDQKAFTQVAATRAADRRKLAVDCAGGNAAQTSSGGSGGGNTSTPCATDSQAASTDEQNVTQAQAKVAADRSALSSAQASLAAAQQTLGTAQSSASTVGQTSVYTKLPKVGAVVHRGQALYAIGGAPVLLLYGGVNPWRAFMPGMSPGADVAELNRNFGLPGDVFTSQTSAAISSLQAAHGLPVTGELLLGGVVFQPGAVRVTSVTPAPGASVQAGPVVNVTSTRRVVTIALDASQQGGIKVGDSVVITLPDNSTTPGRVSFVGTVATTPSDQGAGSSSGPTIEVDVTPEHPAATGRLDQAPVDVSITTATVRGVLAVPVNALVALAGGGYAVEEAAAAGVHQLVAVSVGLFDDAAGMVQVSGSGLAAGQRVVVPAS
jgi:hypothetical protein